MPWNIPRTRKVYLAILVTLSVVAGIAAYTGDRDAGPRPTYEETCKQICEPLPSQVKRTYIDPMSPESRRNMPRKIECLCGSSTSGKQLF